MVNDRFAMTTTACRAVGAVFGAIVTATTPGPFAIPASLIVTQSTGFNFVQAQPAGTTTWTVTTPPAASTDALLGLRVESQPVPCWTTVKVCPATVTPPDLAAPTLGWTASVAVPLPT
jgi:hypothetical protein